MPPRYPRNLTGYGANAPRVAWPEGARVAISLVLNYEEGGENCLLHGDAQSEAFLSDIAGAQPWPGQRHWNMESLYDYGARAGFWRLHRLFTRLGLPVTVYGVATALARSPEQVAAMKHGRLGDRQPRAEMGRTSRHVRGGGARRHRRGDPPAHRGGRAAPARLVHRPRFGQHRAPDRAHRGLRLDLGHLRRRPALLDRTRRS
jgi:peptidoglycan/xylan/chitin deacetylase (PgdA/CDA1 family)